MDKEPRSHQLYLLEGGVTMIELKEFDEICKFGHRLYFACNEKGDKVCPDPVCKLCCREYERKEDIKNWKWVEKYEVKNNLYKGDSVL